MSKVTEIPPKPRSKRYRFFEILPGFMSYVLIILLFVLSIISPVLGATYVLFIIVMMLVRAAGIAVSTLHGNRVLRKAMQVDWQKRLSDLENPAASLKRLKRSNSSAYNFQTHLDNLTRMSVAEAGTYPNPNDVRHVIILTMYDESLEIMEPTIESILRSNYNKQQILLFLAYEARGGEITEQNAQHLLKKYQKKFGDMVLSKHPANLPGEIVGKGPNITYAGHAVRAYLKKQKITPENVIVTTLDSDNRPHETYLTQVAYEYIVHEERQHLSYQPVSLFTNNIWDAPAMMRIIAISNSFWNLICSMRPHVLRNFASHSQPFAVLDQMDFWSKRTIVEDGHQYWRSLFFLDGHYAVLPIRAPIYQDAVLSDTLYQTLKAQFIQLRRWDYGASDVAYVGDYLCSKERTVRLLSLCPKFIRLVDSHVTLAATAPIVVFGGWIPVIFGLQTRVMAAHFLPTLVGLVQMFGSIGLIVTILISLRYIPPRPERYGRIRSILMITQWVLAPIVSIVYSSACAFYSQTRLMLGLYMENFDVTKKAVKK